MSPLYIYKLSQEALARKIAVSLSIEGKNFFKYRDIFTKIESSGNLQKGAATIYLNIGKHNLFIYNWTVHGKQPSSQYETISDIGVICRGVQLRYRSTNTGMDFYSMSYLCQRGTK